VEFTSIGRQLSAIAASDSFITCCWQHRTRPSSTAVEADPTCRDRHTWKEEL